MVSGEQWEGGQFRRLARFEFPPRPLTPPSLLFSQPLQLPFLLREPLLQCCRLGLQLLALRHPPPRNTGQDDG